MFICNNCDAVFDEFAVVTERMGEGVESWAVCPYCGEPGFVKADLCGCRGWKPKGDRICGKCKKRVVQDFAMFLREHTVEEIIWLQDYTDGDPWEDYR